MKTPFGDDEVSHSRRYIPHTYSALTRSDTCGLSDSPPDCKRQQGDRRHVRIVAPYFGVATIQIRRSHLETTLMVFFFSIGCGIETPESLPRYLVGRLWM